MAVKERGFGKVEGSAGGVSQGEKKAGENQEMTCNFNVRGQGVYFRDELVEFCQTKEQAYRLCSLLDLVLRTSERDIKGPFLVDSSDYPSYLIYGGEVASVRIMEGERRNMEGLCSMLNLVVKQTSPPTRPPTSLARGIEEVKELRSKFDVGMNMHLRPKRTLTSWERGIRDTLDWLLDEEHPSPDEC